MNVVAHQTGQLLENKLPRAPAKPAVNSSE